MGLEINGVQVTLPAGELLEFVNKWINPAEVPHFVTRAWPGFGNAGITAPVGFRPMRPARLNTLVWPGNRASAWAYMFVCLDSNRINHIHDSVFGQDGKAYNPVSLAIDSPYPAAGANTRYEKIFTYMYMLPPRPLTTAPGSQLGYPGSGLLPPTGRQTNTLYLITLVDERYWWQYVPWVPITLTDSTTWKQLMDSINASLSPYGLSQITFPDPDAAYLGPSPTAWKLPYESVAQMVDALAFNVGMRFTRKYNGDCLLQKFDDAKAAVSADWSKTPARLQVAGGDAWPLTTPYP